MKYFAELVEHETLWLQGEMFKKSRGKQAISAETASKLSTDKRFKITQEMSVEETEALKQKQAEEKAKMEALKKQAAAAAAEAEKQKSVEAKGK